jgi:hypothetical protein
MRNRFVSLAALCMAPVLVAQDDKKAPPGAGMQMPSDPKTKEHEALKAFVGDWDTTCKMSAMPGVPGMEQPQTSTGPEHSELICNGLFVKSIVNGTFAGKPFQGLMVLGYDPHQKKYTSVWVDNQEGCSCTGTATHDAQKKTWEFSGQTPHGPMRSVIAFSDADNSKETCYMKGPDGKEAVTMEITRKRAKAAAAAGATAAKTAPKAPTPEHEQLLKSVGEWDAAMKMHMVPGQPPMEAKCTETVVPVCHGHWLWTDYRGQVMGAPFEGHGLVGYDTNKKQYVSFWFDSMSAPYMASTGTCDPATKTVKMTGKGVDESGKPMTTDETITWKDENTRVLNMEFKTDQGPMKMEITYTRKGKS